MPCYVTFLTSIWRNVGSRCHSWILYKIQECTSIQCSSAHTGHISSVSLTPPLLDVAVILEVIFKSFYESIIWALALVLLSAECHKTPFMISQHWFWWWLGACQGAIWPSLSPCTVINPILLTYLLGACHQASSNYLSQCWPRLPDLCHHMMLLGHRDITECKAKSLNSVLIL